MLGLSAGVAAIGVTRRDCCRAAEAYLQSLLVRHLHGHSRHAHPTGSLCRLDDLYTHPHGNASTQGMSGFPPCLLYTGWKHALRKCCIVHAAFAMNELCLKHRTTQSMISNVQQPEGNLP